MPLNTPILRCSMIAGVVLALGACGERQGAQAGADSPAATAAAAATPRLTVPAGRYRLDPNHASFIWSVPHYGLSNYTARFTKFDATVTLDPQNISASRVSFTVDPTSVRTDYPGDYRATHQSSGFQSWDEDLALNERFFNAKQFPQITFESTKVEPTGERTARVTGDLSFLGVTRPVVLTVTLNGEMASHPFSKAPALGFTAEGEFNRSEFGMRPSAAVGDRVRVVFNGEFQQEAAASAGD